MNENPYARFACDRCGAAFLFREARRSPRGDPTCPACGSPRLDPVVTGLQRLARFLIAYERY